MRPARKLVFGLAAFLAACAASSGQAVHSPNGVRVALPTAGPAYLPSIALPPRPTPSPAARPPARKPVVKTAPVVRHPHSSAPATHHAPTKAAPLLVTRLSGVGNARQVISVVASGYGTSSATLQAFEKTGSTWHRVFGPWSAHVGRHGFAPPGEKREGDLRTPTGSYGFSFFFGVRANPGVRYEWRPVTGSYIVWDDDPSSARYNLWSDVRHDDAGRNPEPMDNTPAYNYAAVIAYNTSRTPGRGSAIFFHVSTGGGTAGCVSLPTSQLLDVFRWMDPAKSPRIIMGTESAVT
jgi:L,D-peptidoglycan transpeptidase YkuD (ErfK/YbiS/YcfS/YnhG family)